MPEDLRTAKPTMKGNDLPYSKGDCHKLLKVGPLRAIADDVEVSQTILQEGGRGAQSKITSLPRNQSANENQLKCVSLVSDWA